MTTLRMTKNELRDQERRLNQLEKYLPTLQLKKAMLQLEVNNTQMEIESLTEELEKASEKVNSFSPFLVEKTEYDLTACAEVRQIRKNYENIAGVEISIFERVIFVDATYFLFDTPAWMDSAVFKIKKMVELREKIKVSEEKKRALKKELREVSIRVNLFEKILIPRAKGFIKKIKIFLGDQQLAAVSQAKVAKVKIEQKKMAAFS